MLQSKKRRVLVALGAIGAIAAVGVAVAYFTTTGSGTGSATVGTSSAVTIHGTTASSLFPGTSTTVSFTVDNPSAGQRVNEIHLESVTTDAAHSACVMSDFTMPNVTVNQVFPSGNAQAVTATGTLSMANTAQNQDACQGAPLTLHLTSN
jgi:hypothetical protein